VEFIAFEQLDEELEVGEPQHENSRGGGVQHENSVAMVTSGNEGGPGDGAEQQHGASEGGSEEESAAAEEALEGSGVVSCGEDESLQQVKPKGTE